MLLTINYIFAMIYISKLIFMSFVITIFFLVLISFISFYLSYKMKKNNAYLLFNKLEKIGFIVLFTFVTCSGFALLFQKLAWEKEGLILLQIFSTAAHLIVYADKRNEPYSEELI